MPTIWRHANKADPAATAATHPNTPTHKRTMAGEHTPSAPGRGGCSGNRARRHPGGSLREPAKGLVGGGARGLAQGLRPRGARLVPGAEVPVGGDDDASVDDDGPAHFQVSGAHPRATAEDHGARVAIDGIELGAVHEPHESIAALFVTRRRDRRLVALIAPPRYWPPRRTTPSWR